ncbi:MAG: hypothetical protein K8S62_07695 [Candidatus Sabulitectum sp.]|nr:hypothetical protein [Candidatus Sabulitectum sp.]
MLKKYWYLIVAAVVGLVLLFTGLPERSNLPGIPVCEPGEIMVELDTNDDGNTDFWAFLNQDSVPVGSIGDTNFDGRPDSWSHFRNGRAFLDQEDTDNDGMIDLIILSLYNRDESKIRSILLRLEEENLFVAAEDTEWLECGTIFSHQPDSLHAAPVFESGEIITERDRNDDGNIDFWLFSDLNNVPVRLVLDIDFDGRPDNWSHFKNGRAFLDQEDTDNDGIIDFILLCIYDEEERNMREVLFLLEEDNLFATTADTGWLECSTTSSTNPFFHTYRDGYPPEATDNL